MRQINDMLPELLKIEKTRDHEIDYNFVWQFFDMLLKICIDLAAQS